MAIINYHAFTANPSNSFTFAAMGKYEEGDEFLHSVHGRGIVVCVKKVGIGSRLTVRTDITLDEFIEEL